MAFAIPSVLPQDLRLIHDLIGDIPTPSKTASQHGQQLTYDDSDHDHGTDSDTDSEKEVEADIFAGVDDELAPPSESESDSDSPSSDSDIEEPGTQKPPLTRNQIDDDDDEAEHTINVDARLRTRNELLDVAIAVPDISEVGPHEQLEKVGEILNIVDKVVIVRGIPSSIANRGSEKALDSDTLLVFEDRKVLGYIFETFGPTSEPLYQIRFNENHSLDPGTVFLGRSVFHVPAKSNYVFVQQLRHLKGSDASNVHDEEPADDEVEFSDDEQEAAHKRAQAGRREQSRARSVVSSRQSTPLPSRMRDQDMVDDPYMGPPYDPLPYLDAGPSRPTPTPYDDPYSDSYGTMPLDPKEDSPKSPQSSHRFVDQDRGRGGHSRGFAPGADKIGRGRGRGRGRRHNDRGRGRGRGTSHRLPPDPWPGGGPDEYDPRNPRPVSPVTIAQSTAQGSVADMSGGWSYPNPQYPHASDFGLSYQYPHVQPHINPRFAANFGMAGMGMGYMSYGDSAVPSYDTGGHSGTTWGEEWGGPYDRQEERL